MKRLFVGMVLGMFLLCTLVLVVSGLSLCDFRSPETAMTNANMMISYRYFDDARTPGVDVNAGRIRLLFDSLFDSSDIGYSVSGAAEVGLVDFLPNTWLGQGAGTFRYYMHDEAPLFAFGGLDGMAGPNVCGLEVRAGMGYGRFTDVTPLALAMEIEQLLLDLGTVDADLPADLKMSLAQIIARRIEYESIPLWVADMEEAIEGTLGVDLDARSLLRIEEIVLQTANRRRCGWAVQGGLGYEIIDPTGGERDLLLAFSADAAFTTSYAEQLVMRASFSGPFDILDENRLSVNASYAYRMASNAAVAAGYTMHRAKPSGEVATSSQSISLSVSLGLGGADLVFQLSLTRGDEPGWSVDLSVAAAMNLL